LCAKWEAMETVDELILQKADTLGTMIDLFLNSAGE
jgi:hypothetical protein